MRVVIIEDDEGIGFSLRLALEDRGHDVEVYADPTGVPYGSLAADVLLVDYYMPKMDGAEVIARLKAESKLGDARIFLMSAAPNIERQAEQLGVTCIPKPFDLDKLFERIETSERDASGEADEVSEQP